MLNLKNKNVRKQINTWKENYELQKTSEEIINVNNNKNGALITYRPIEWIPLCSSNKGCELWNIVYCSAWFQLKRWSSIIPWITISELKLVASFPFRPESQSENCLMQDGKYILWKHFASAVWSSAYNVFLNSLNALLVSLGIWTQIAANINIFTTNSLLLCSLCYLCCIL